MPGVRDFPQDRRYCYPLTVTDHASRRIMACEALQSTRELPVIAAFERLFAEHGLPLAMRSDNGLPEIEYPFHVKDVLVTACGRICMHRKKFNVSTVLPGHRLGPKEVDDAIWLVTFMTYDLGYIDLEQRALQTIDNPFGSRLSPMS